MELSQKHKITFLFILCVLIVIAYTSGLKATWHLDDFPNIVRNEKIHLTRIDCQSMLATFFAGPGANLYRPLPMASFALNWYFHGADVTDYHWINVFIHCVNGCLVFLIMLELMQTPRMKNETQQLEVHRIVMVAAILWALNPIQTQAVTYIVQRMTSMAAMFSLVGIYAYLRYKKNMSVTSRRLWLTVCVLVCLLALLSKESTVLLPINLYLIHLVFYASVEETSSNKRVWIVMSGLLVGTLLLGLAYFFASRGNPLQTLSNLYADRPFTPGQRLLTEPRIVWFYLTLLVFPHPGRLSLGHDFSISNSFFDPWTTLPAIISILGAIGLSCLYYRKRPLLSFAVLFFFLNHAVESTILPLELVFEHRNYLPSVFLFLPFSYYLFKYLRKPCLDTQTSRYLFWGAIFLVVGTFCNWTFARNMVWLSEKTLWEDEIAKNPQSARPLHNLAWGYYHARGEYEKALPLYEKSLAAKPHTAFETASTMNNIGRIHYINGNYERSLGWFEKAVSAYPKLRIAEYQLVATLCQLERWQEALKRTDAYLNKSAADPFFLKMKGVILTKTGMDDKSISFLYKSLELNPSSKDVRGHLSLALSRMGRIDEAVAVVTDGPAGEYPLFLLVLADIERIQGNLARADDYLRRLLKTRSIEDIKKQFSTWKKDNLSITVDYDYYLDRLNRLVRE